jgi:hypothetical protein
MEPTAAPETSSRNLPYTPCKIPKTKNQYSFHGGSLKSRSYLLLDIYNLFVKVMRSHGLVSCKAYIHCPYKLTGLIMPWRMSRNWQLTVYDDVSVRQLHVELFSDCVSTPQSTYALQVWDNNFHIFEVKGLVFTALDGCKSLAARSGSFIPSSNWKWGWWVAQQV